MLHPTSQGPLPAGLASGRAGRARAGGVKCGRVFAGERGVRGERAGRGNLAASGEEGHPSGRCRYPRLAPRETLRLRSGQTVGHPRCC